MLDRFVEIILSGAASLVGLFVPPGAQSDLLQMGAALLILATLIALIAFWRHFRSRRRRARDSAQP